MKITFKNISAPPSVIWISDIQKAYPKDWGKGTVFTWHWKINKLGASKLQKEKFPQLGCHIDNKELSGVIFSPLMISVYTAVGGCRQYKLAVGIFMAAS